MDDSVIELGLWGLEFHVDLIFSSLALLDLPFGPLDGLDSELFLDFFLDFFAIDFFLKLSFPFESIIFQNGLALSFVFV